MIMEIIIFLISKTLINKTFRKVVKDRYKPSLLVNIKYKSDRIENVYYCLATICNALYKYSLPSFMIFKLKGEYTFK